MAIQAAQQLAGNGRLLPPPVAGGINPAAFTGNQQMQTMQPSQMQRLPMQQMQPMQAQQLPQMQQMQPMQQQMPQQQNIQPYQQQYMQTPQTGLIGSEMALQQGLSGSMGLLQQGGNAMQDATQRATDLLAGYRPDETAGSYTAAKASIGSGIGEGVSALNPYQTMGNTTQDMELALLGGGTPEQQAAAMQQLQASPGFQFAQQQGERAALRNSAATGGLQSGSVQKELARFNQGLAGQQFNTRLGQLTGMSNRGLAASQSIGDLYGRKAQLGTSVNLANAAGENTANQAAANAAVGREAMAGNRVSQSADMISGTGMNIANMYGRAASDVMGTGNLMSGGRLQTGRDMSQNLGAGTSALAGLVNAQGSTLGDLYGGGALNAANIISGLANQGGLDQASIAQMLAAAETGTAGRIAGLPSAAALQRPVDHMGNNAAIMNSIGGVAKAYDKIPKKQP